MLTDSTTDVNTAWTKLREVKRHNFDRLDISELTHALATLKALYESQVLEGGAQNELRQTDRDCLVTSLQAAITLEFATIPPYLCALWSIRDELHPAAKSIRNVVQEEMLHMALACNMLASLGVTPKIDNPSYPGVLPGGVHDGLVVELSGLTKHALLDFMWIERPVHEVPIQNPYGETQGGPKFEEHDQSFSASRDQTIGEFYDQIRAGFQRYLADSANPPLNHDHQVTGPLAYTVIRDMNSVNWAIDLIKAQGEGSENDPEISKGNLSHYYRFMEVYHGVEYKWNATSKRLDVVASGLPFPDVFPMTVVPSGGYDIRSVSDDVRHHLIQFDKTYTKLLEQLRAAWSLGTSQSALVCAYGTMFDLGDHARALMQIRTPYGGGATYGPCFRELA